MVNNKGPNELVEKKRGKLFRDSTLPNHEIGSDESVSMHGITTATLQDEDLEWDDYLD